MAYRDILIIEGLKKNIWGDAELNKQSFGL